MGHDHEVFALHCFALHCVCTAFNKCYGMDRFWSFPAQTPTRFLSHLLSFLSLHTIYPKLFLQAKLKSVGWPACVLLDRKGKVDLA